MLNKVLPTSKKYDRTLSLLLRDFFFALIMQFTFQVISKWVETFGERPAYLPTYKYVSGNQLRVKDAKKHLKTYLILV